MSLLKCNGKLVKIGTKLIKIQEEQNQAGSFEYTFKFTYDNDTEEKTRTLSSENLLNSDSFTYQYNNNTYRAYEDFIAYTNFATYYDAEAFISGLNDNNVGSRSDWRLIQSGDEMRSICLVNEVENYMGYDGHTIEETWTSQDAELEGNKEKYYLYGDASDWADEQGFSKNDRVSSTGFIVVCGTN